MDELQALHQKSVRAAIAGTEAGDSASLHCIMRHTHWWQTQTRSMAVVLLLDSMAEQKDKWCFIVDTGCAGCRRSTSVMDSSLIGENTWRARFSKFRFFFTEVHLFYLFHHVSTFSCCPSVSCITQELEIMCDKPAWAHLSKPTLWNVRT